MTIEKILEKKINPTSWRGKNVKFNLLVHCSCGEDYKVKEKLPHFETEEYIRPTECRSCKDVSYIRYTMQTWPFTDGLYFGQFGVSIVTDEVTVNDKRN